MLLFVTGHSGPVVLLTPYSLRGTADMGAGARAACYCSARVPWAWPRGRGGAWPLGPGTDRGVQTDYPDNAHTPASHSTHVTARHTHLSLFGEGPGGARHRSHRSTHTAHAFGSHTSTRPNRQFARRMKGAYRPGAEGVGQQRAVGRDRRLSPQRTRTH